MGPMGFAQYQRMLQGGDGYKRLVSWVRNYVGDRLSWEVQLVVKAQDVPETQLGRMGRLGCSTWLLSHPFKKNADDCVLRPAVA